MNRAEAQRYIQNLRKALPPVPEGLEAEDIAGRKKIGDLARRIRHKHAPYKEAIEVFKRAGEVHRDNLRIRDREGKPTGEKFSPNAFAYLSGLLDESGVAKAVFPAAKTYTSVYSPEAIDYYDFRFIVPSTVMGNQILFVESWSPHRDAKGNLAPLLLESYFLVKGEGIHSMQIPQFDRLKTPPPPIRTWAKTTDPQGEMDISHIAAFFYHEINKDKPQDSA